MVGYETCEYGNVKINCWEMQCYVQLNILEGGSFFKLLCNAGCNALGHWPPHALLTLINSLHLHCHAFLLVSFFMHFTCIFMHCAFLLLTNEDASPAVTS